MRKSLVCLLVLIPISGIAEGDDGESARERYDAAVAQALAQYLVEVEEEIKAAGAEGQLEEANRLAAERDSISESPVDELTENLVGTRWSFGSGRYLEFRSNGRAINHVGNSAVWIASDERTVLMQYHQTQVVYVWKFSENLQSVARYQFEPTEIVERPRRISR